MKDEDIDWRHSIEQWCMTGPIPRFSWTRVAGRAAKEVCFTLVGFMILLFSRACFSFSIQLGTIAFVLVSAGLLALLFLKIVAILEGITWIMNYGLPFKMAVRTASEAILRRTQEAWLETLRAEGLLRSLGIKCWLPFGIMDIRLRRGGGEYFRQCFFRVKRLIYLFAIYSVLLPTTISKDSSVTALGIALSFLSLTMLTLMVSEIIIGHTLLGVDYDRYVRNVPPRHDGLIRLTGIANFGEFLWLIAITGASGCLALQALPGGPSFNDLPEPLFTANFADRVTVFINYVYRMGIGIATFGYSSFAPNGQLANGFVGLLYLTGFISLLFGLQAILSTDDSD